MSQPATHENLISKDKVKSSSNKSFGLVFAVVFLLVGLWPIISGKPFRFWAFAICGLLILISIIRPEILGPLNRIWFRFGLSLHKIINPFVMGLIFYTTVTPIGLIMRALGKRPLSIDFDPKAKSYWVERKPRGPEPETMTNQF